ncbi:MAG: hypothetical protein J6J01_01405 [Oscillospiraceae bacterium]|nr:hypothetical protein [Clostridia bacterium]MBP3698127.1 hypothetical protein [Oscillospiraceae bacterium]
MAIVHKEVTAMPIGISLQTVPTYRLSAFRQFLPGERHITRVESSVILLLMPDGVLRFAENEAAPWIVKDGCSVRS